MKFKECDICGHRADEHEPDFEEVICPNCNTDLEEFEE